MKPRNVVRKGPRMSIVAVVSAVVTALSPVFIAVFTWIVNRRINNRTAQDAALNLRLEQQRNDFNAVVTPLKDRVTELSSSNQSLADKVQRLEGRVDHAEDDRRYLVYDFRRTHHYYRDRYSDDGPALTARTLAILGMGNND